MASSGKTLHARPVFFLPAPFRSFWSLPPASQSPRDCQSFQPTGDIPTSWAVGSSVFTELLWVAPAGVLEVRSDGRPDVACLCIECSQWLAQLAQEIERR